MGVADMSKLHLHSHALQNIGGFSMVFPVYMTIHVVELNLSATMCNFRGNVHSHTWRKVRPAVSRTRVMVMLRQVRKHHLWNDTFSKAQRSWETANCRRFATQRDSRILYCCVDMTCLKTFKKQGANLALGLLRVMPPKKCTCLLTACCSPGAHYEEGLLCPTQLTCCSDSPTPSRMSFEKFFNVILQDPHFQEMRTDYTVPFLQNFNMGCAALGSRSRQRIAQLRSDVTQKDDQSR